METDNRLMVKNLQKLNVFYAVYSKATNLPYAKCDRQTYDDQAYIFTYEADASEFADGLNADNYPCLVKKIEKKDFAAYYSSLFLTGINGIIFHNGTGEAPLPLEEVVTFHRPEQKKNAPPVSNESLQMTAVYFLQEVRRPNMDAHDPGRNLTLQGLEQELVANLRRSRFIIGFDVTDSKADAQSGGKVPRDAKIPYLKTKNGDMMEPIFSDMWEFQKFVKGNKSKYKLVALPFDKLIPTPFKEAKGFVLNPAGFNLSLSKEKVEKMIEAGKFTYTVDIKE